MEMPMKAVIERRCWAAALLLTGLASSVFGIRDAEASSMNGTWRIENLVLDIFDCQLQVCGRIVWIGDPSRRPSQCGRTIVWGLSPSGPAEWKGGSIFDPDDGNTYRLSASFQSDGTLHARIFRGIELFGKTKVLKRVDISALSGRC
jgi:uncharacterized protein (DUF2147 family)